VRIQAKELMMSHQNNELTQYYDQNDTSELLAGAVREQPSGQVEPMVTYALRMPQESLNALRAVAAHHGLKVSALMRPWLLERLSDEDALDHARVQIDVASLLAFIAEHGNRPGPDTPSGSEVELPQAS
jgi:hypothetical protein